MKIQDLPEHTKFSQVKVKLPENVREFANQFGDDIPEEVWLAGPMMSDWFVKKTREDTQVFPLFREHISYGELKEWEVVEIYNE